MEWSLSKTGVLAALLVLYTSIPCSQATSTRLAPHKRVHVPNRISFAIVRKRKAHSYNASKNSKRGAIASDGSTFGSVGAAGLGGAVVRKRSTLPTPFELLDGSQERPLHDDTILFQLEVPSEHDSLLHYHDQREKLSDRISILLRPTENILHPDARVVYTTVDPVTGVTTESVERLAREDVLAYSGYVIREEDVAARMSAERVGMRIGDEEQSGRGWARITLSSSAGLLNEDGTEKLVPEGAFELDGEVHHLKALHKYERLASASPSNRQPSLNPRQYVNHQGTVLLRDRDLEYGAFEPPQITKRGWNPSGFTRNSSMSSCSHDSLSFNSDLDHPIYKEARQMAFEAEYGRKSTWLDSLMGITPETFNHHMRRQSGGDLAGGGNMSSNYISSIGSTTGCPKTSQVVYMGLAADCSYTSNYGSVTAAREQLLTNMNTVSALYQSTYNISLGVVQLNVQDATCPSTTNSSVPWNVACSDSSSSSNSSSLDLNGRLSAFSKWRSNKGGGDGAGLWHLLTACSTGSEVGVAWLGTVCKVAASTSSDGETTSGTGVTAITDREWQVMAHEIGHNFGAIHDCTSGCSLSGSCCPLTKTSCDCKCNLRLGLHGLNEGVGYAASSNYIMSPVSIKNTTSFSSCTIGNVCTALGTTLNTTCLYTPGDRTVISLQQCGNGILEPGEECDPGSNTSSSCCDASTCKLKSGAVCDPSTSSCCTSSCQYASSTQICRPAVSDECDIAETCTGSSADCPEDKTEADGKSCGSNGLECASGYCTSKDQQCENLGSSMGITQACGNVGDTSCSVTCANPNSTSSCIILEGQNFVDGTSCGYGGHCQDGNCKAGSWQDTVAAWYRQNLKISIPVTVVGGLLILLFLYGIVRCCIRGCARGYAKPASSKYANGNTPARYSVPPPPPPPMAQQNNANGWTEHTYGYGYHEPQPPYPIYQQNGQPAFENGHYQNGYYR